MKTFVTRVHALKEKYPYQFSRVGEYGLSIEPGWIGILEQVCEQVHALLTEEQRQIFSWSQIKQKLGSLCLYWVNPWIEPEPGSNYIDRVGDITWDPGVPDEMKRRVIHAIMLQTMLPMDVCEKIRTITHASAKQGETTCQFCGQPGTHQVVDGYHCTVCEQHAIHDAIVAVREQQEAEYVANPY